MTMTMLLTAKLNVNFLAVINYKVEYGSKY